MSVGPLDGLVSGLNTSSVIQQLLAADAQPQDQLKQQQSNLNAESAAWGTIAGKLTAFSTATSALSGATSTQAVTASTSDSTLATATATTASSASSLTFRTIALASAQQVASSAFASSSTLVGAGNITVVDGGQTLGISNVQAASTISAGTSTLTVSRASTAGTLTGHLPTFPIIIGQGQQMAVVINGVAHVATLTAGTYTSLDPIAAQLATQFGPDAAVSVSSGGALQVSTANEGSGQTIGQLTGTAASALGLDGLDTASASGTDGLIAYGSDQVTVSNTAAGQTVSVGGATVTLSGGHLSAGSATLNTVTMSSTSTVADVAAALNNLSGGTVRASAIATGSDGSGAKLVISGASTGTAHQISIDAGTTSVGTFTTLRAAADAQVQLGTGANLLTLTRSSNTITDLMPGVTVNLVKADPNTDVTISTATDTAGLTTKVKAIVDSLNDLMSTIKSYTGYNTTTNQGGVLLGDSRVQSLVSQIQSSLQRSLPSGTVRTLSQLGISIQQDGTYSFDQTAFQTALSSDPTSVTKLLSQQATTSDPRAVFLSAGAAATSGNASIVITQAARQASVDGNAFGTLTQNEHLSITQSGITATFDALAGSDASTVAAGLQAVLKAAGLSMTASVVNGQIHLATKGYGSAANFSITSDGSGTGLGDATPTGHNGADVVGLVDGISTTGVGQLLTATKGSGTGLAMQITATDADVQAASGSLSLGSITYNGGAAGDLTSLIAGLTSATGAITQAKSDDDTQSAALQTQIDDWTQKLNDKETAYRQQFAQMETMLGQLKSQQAQLSSQLASLPGSTNLLSG